MSLFIVELVFIKFVCEEKFCMFVVILFMFMLLYVLLVLFAFKSMIFMMFLYSCWLLLFCWILFKFICFKVKMIFWVIKSMLFVILICFFFIFIIKGLMIFWLVYCWDKFNSFFKIFRDCFKLIKVWFGCLFGCDGCVCELFFRFLFKRVFVLFFKIFK